MHGRVKYIDVARGFSMICIVCGHMNNPRINQFVFTFHVPLFFLISGYFFKENEKWDIFLKKKCKTLLIPYYLSCIVLAVSSAVFNELSYGGNDTKQLIIDWVKAALYGAGHSRAVPVDWKFIGALWFLWATFWGLVILKLLYKLRWQIKIGILLILVIVCVLSAEKLWLPLSIQTGPIAALYMYMGTEWKKNEGIKLSPETKAVITVLALGVWICFIRDFTTFYIVLADVGRGAIDIAGSLCGCYCVLLGCKWLCKQEKHLSSALAYIGRFSIIFLCVHNMELNVIRWDALVARLFGEVGEYALYIKLGLKFLWIIPMTLLLSRIKAVRILFGLCGLKSLKQKE